MTRLSSTYYPMDFLINQVKKWIPGALSIQALYNQSNRLFYYDGDEQHLISLSENDNMLYLLKHRTRKNRYAWVDNSFFNGQIDGVSQLSIDKELDHHFLAIFLVNPIDQLSDIMLIEFPPHVNPFRVKNATINLTTGDKENLGSVLYSVVSIEYNRVFEENKALQALNSGVDKLKKELDTYKKALSELQSQMANEFNASLEYILVQILVEHKIRITILEDTFTLLKNRKVNESDLKRIILEAAYLEMVTQSNNTEIQLTPYFIQSAISSNKAVLENKFDKTTYILDKYEDAAANLLLKKQAINGKNIASYLQVTPPALTDAVKKNTPKIAMLLKNYPEKWPLIRSYLKPIQRISSTNLKSA